MQQSQIMRRTFFSHFLRYLAISMLIIASLLPLYFTANRSAHQALVTQMEQTLRRNLEQLERRLLQLQLHADRVAASDEIMRVAISTDADDRLPIALFGAAELYRTNAWDYEFTQNVLVQFARNDALVSLGKVYEDKRFFFANAFVMEGYTFEALQARLYDDREKCLGPVYMQSDVSGEVILLNSYYNAFEGRPSIIVSFVVPVASILDLLIPEEVAACSHVLFTQTFPGAATPSSTGHPSMATWCTMTSAATAPA